MSGAFVNRGLARLRHGEALASIWLSLGSCALAEIAAETAPDVIVFDAQHGLWDSTTLHSALDAVSKRSTPLVRVAANIPHLIGQALDSGAHGVIVPYIESAAQAAQAVAAARFPPHGHRSGGGVRPLADFPSYVDACSREVMVAVMIETCAGLANAQEIIATPGVDMIFIGPGDLMLSLGDDGAQDIELHLHAILTASRAGRVPCGLFTPDARQARRRIAEGFRFVVAADDIGMARRGLTQSLDELSREDPR